MLDAKKQTGENRVPYLRNSNVRWGNFELTDLAEMDVRPEEFDRVAARSGDLVMCEGGEPGRCAIWRGEPIALQKALHRIRPDTKRVTPEFLFLAFQFLAVNGELARRFTGSTIKHLPKEQLRQLEILVPPLADQEEIVSATATQFESIRIGRDHLAEAERRLEALHRSILANAFNPAGGGAGNR